MGFYSAFNGLMLEDLGFPRHYSENNHNISASRE